jgi:hypothetical protein
LPALLIVGGGHASDAKMLEVMFPVPALPVCHNLRGGAHGFAFLHEPLSGGSHPEGRHGGVHRTAPRATGRHGISGHGGGGFGAQAEVGMGVEADAISIGKEFCPLVTAEKAVVVGNMRTFALSNTTSFADQVVGLQITILQQNYQTKGLTI